MNKLSLMIGIFALAILLAACSQNKDAVDIALDQPYTPPADTNTATPPPATEPPVTLPPATIYYGKLLGGNKDPYLEFNTPGFQNALKENKVILLYFFKSDCPICRTEQVYLKDALVSLDTGKVVAFRVNIKDTDTDSDEVALANLYEVTNDHTKVILKDGKLVLKTTGSWNARLFETQIVQFLQ